jgi:hypothetical protein
MKLVSLALVLVMFAGLAGLVFAQDAAPSAAPAGDAAASAAPTPATTAPATPAPDASAAPEHGGHK